ncbi:TonB-dependent siderophore receptor [Agrobacterium salinitolerans]|uniref:TonB-dependent siderophore receptor n=1 Tax=Agrobacterium salinitolerans TaxID=1183413 RepID=UPI0022B82097|nr:TonB-dependent siderophore receptor [Agrobacterium salinitolerans]MCZ7856422.1 TonB-dependent siderophore receptor [Agrobacterium salinitolerans]
MKNLHGMFLSRLLLGTAAVVLMEPVMGHAQETTVLQQITVEGQGAENATGPVRGYVATKSASGSKTETETKDIPQSVSVVGRQEMDDRGAVTKIDEVLRYTPGVTAEPFGADPDTDWFYIRGFQATQTGVFLDGLNLFSYGFGGFQMDAYGLERVEVLKGPASVLYGGANPGGIVQMVRKRPQDEPVRETEIGINNFGNAFFGFDLGDKVDGEGVWKYRVTGKVSGGDNYTDYSEDLRGFIMPQITFEPDAQTSATLYGYFSALDQVHIGNGFLPYVGTVVDAPFGKLDRKAFYGEPDIDNGRVYQSMVGYEVSHEFDNGWKISQNARYGHLYKHEKGPYPGGWANAGANGQPILDPTTNDYMLTRFGYDGLSKVDSFGIDNRVEGQFDTGAVSHSLLFGLDYKYYRLDQVQACCGSNAIGALKPVYGSTQGTNFVYADNIVTQQQIGIYAQDQLRFGDGWLVTLNGRYDYVDTELNNRLPAGVSRRSNDDALSGRAGLAYEFDNGLTPYISAATFFNPLIDTLADGTPASPEEGHQFEAGIKYEPSFFDGSITASVFKLVKDNAIVSYTAGGVTTSGQFGQVESTGFELEAKANLSENWKALASYSYTDLEITRDANPNLIGKSPWIVPTQTASLWLDYTFTNDALDGLSLGGGVRYQGKSWADEANTLRVPDAAVFDAAIRYEKNDWTASINVANVFDKEYVKSCAGVSVCGWGDSRTVTFKLSKKW